MTFDQEFTKKYNETQDLQKTWLWFNDYFKIEGLQKPLAYFKDKAVREDREKRKLATKNT